MFIFRTSDNKLKLKILAIIAGKVNKGLDYLKIFRFSGGT